MKSAAVVLALLGSVLASPIGQRDIGLTANEYVEGGCKDVIFFFARGTNQDGNMGKTVGVPYGNLLKKHYNTKIAIQGIDYPATLTGNLEPDGANAKGIKKMRDIVIEATEKCPNSKIVISGYSQGAAVVHGAAKRWSAAIVSRVNAAVTFGDTRKKQDKGMIPNFPPEKTLIICNEGDDVCEGSLKTNPPHFEYEKRTPEAAEFVYKVLGF